MRYASADTESDRIMPYCQAPTSTGEGVAKLAVTEHVGNVTFSCCSVDSYSATTAIFSQSGEKSKFKTSLKANPKATRLETGLKTRFHHPWPLCEKPTHHTKQGPNAAHGAGRPIDSAPGGKGQSQTSLFHHPSSMLWHALSTYQLDIAANPARRSACDSSSSKEHSFRASFYNLAATDTWTSFLPDRVGGRYVVATPPSNA